MSIREPLDYSNQCIHLRLKRRPTLQPTALGPDCIDPLWSRVGTCAEIGPPFAATTVPLRVAASTALARRMPKLYPQPSPPDDHAGQAKGKTTHAQRHD